MRSQIQLKKALTCTCYSLFWLLLLFNIYLIAYSVTRHHHHQLISCNAYYTIDHNPHHIRYIYVCVCVCFDRYCSNKSPTKAQSQLKPGPTRLGWGHEWSLSPLTYVHIHKGSHSRQVTPGHAPAAWPGKTQWNDLRRLNISTEKEPSEGETGFPPLSPPPCNTSQLIHETLPPWPGIR